MHSNLTFLYYYYFTFLGGNILLFKMTFSAFLVNDSSNRANAVKCFAILKLYFFLGLSID